MVNSAPLLLTLTSIIAQLYTNKEFFKEFGQNIRKNQDVAKDFARSIHKIIEGFEADLVSDVLPYPEAVGWTIEEQVENRGYIFEEHKITTEDGYILTAFRIPCRFIHSKCYEGPNKQYPVYMQHGLCDHGGTWIFNNESLSLAYQLVDRGYDVWLTNSRGTVHSQGHTKYRTNSKNFWNFTLNELA